MSLRNDLYEMDANEPFFSFPSHPSQSPYSILHNIQYDFKFHIQNPTQKIVQPTKDSLDKEFVRCIIRILLKELDLNIQEFHRNHSIVNNTNNEIITSSPSSLNVYIKDLNCVPRLKDENRIYHLVFNHIQDFYSMKRIQNNKTDSYNVNSFYNQLESNQLDNNQKNIDLDISFDPFENSTRDEYTSLEDNSATSQITCKLSNNQIIEKIKNLYTKIMSEYNLYTNKYFIPYIGELPAEEKVKKLNKIVHQLLSFKISTIASTNEFWGIDLTDEGNSNNLRDDLEFHHIRNDGTISSLKLLNAVKKVYSNQLPNMPTHYIVRLVFDRSHRSMLAVKDGLVVGGITYKPFEPQGFCEIAFVAVDASLQVKQCGTRLMNHLKDHFKKEGKIWRFLTFADNSAVGFFKKMGFSKDVTIQNWRYSSYIKYYTDVSLMECVLRPGIPYLNVRDWISKQEENLNNHLAIQEKRREEQPSDYTIQVKPSKSYFGLYFNSKGNLYNKYKGSRIKKIEDIPGLKNARGISKLPTDIEISTLNLNLKEIWKTLNNHQDSDKLKYEEVIEYSISNEIPADLRLIGERIDKMYYRHSEMFTADIRRLFEYISPSHSLKNITNLFLKKMKEVGFDANL